MAKTVKQTAEELAQAHKADDPDLQAVYMVPTVSNEVWLVEVSGSVTPIGEPEILPFRFNAQPTEGIDYPSAIVLISPRGWDALERGHLHLPPGWGDRADLQQIL